MLTFLEFILENKKIDRLKELEIKIIDAEEDEKIDIQAQIDIITDKINTEANKN